MKFANRSDAGRRLAGKLMHLKERQPVILALPRGGVAIGFEIARTLGAPLDIVLVRKIGVPWEPELAVGAVTDGATPETFIDWALAAALEIPESYLEEETARPARRDRTAPGDLLRGPSAGGNQRAHSGRRRRRDRHRRNDARSLAGHAEPGPLASGRGRAGGATGHAGGIEQNRRRDALPRDADRPWRDRLLLS
jgi:hypothetical protein